MEGDLGEAIGFGILVGSLAGALCGLVPLILGITRSQRGLAIGGFGACVLCGAILGLVLAVPIAGLFTYLIVRASRARTPQAPLPDTYGRAPPTPPGGYYGVAQPPPPGAAGGALHTPSPPGGWGQAAGQPEASASSALAPGWHPDPYGQARLRWWDGARWSEHTAA